MPMVHFAEIKLLHISQRLIYPSLVKMGLVKIRSQETKGYNSFTEFHDYGIVLTEVQ